MFNAFIARRNFSRSRENAPTRGALFAHKLACFLSMIILGRKNAFKPPESALKLRNRGHNGMSSDTCQARLSCRVQSKAIGTCALISIGSQ